MKPIWAVPAGRLAVGIIAFVLGLSACGLTVTAQRSATPTRIRERAVAQSLLLVITDPQSPSTLAATRNLISQTARPRERLFILDAHSGMLIATATAPAALSTSVPGPPKPLAAGSTSYQKARYLKAVSHYHSKVRQASAALRRRQQEHLANWARSALGNLTPGEVRSDPRIISTKAALATAAADFSSLHEAGINDNGHSVVVIMTPPVKATSAVPTLSSDMHDVTLVVSNFTGSSTAQAAWQEGLLQAGARRVVLLTPATQSQVSPIVREGLDGALTDTLTHVLFASGKYQLRPAAVPQLERLLHLLTVTYPTATVSISGYTDNVPAATPGGNPELSLRRAQAVKAWLVTHGVAAARMQVAGYGEADPLAPNTPHGQPLNRRVVIVIDPVTGS